MMIYKSFNSPLDRLSLVVLHENLICDSRESLINTRVITAQKMGVFKGSVEPVQIVEGTLQRL